MSLDTKFFGWLAISTVFINLVYLFGLIQFVMVFFGSWTPSLLIPLCVIAAWFIDRRIDEMLLSYLVILLNEKEGK